MGAQTLFTIGYEGAALADFIATLGAAGVELVIDVREIPASRRKGFSKTPLSEALSDARTGYVHLRELGDPKPGRLAARRGDFGTFQEIYRQHLTRPESQAALSVALRLAHAQSACLLCFERDHQTCHRTIIASAMTAASGLNIQHLGVRAGIAAGRRMLHGIDADRRCHLG